MKHTIKIVVDAPWLTERLPGDRIVMWARSDIESLLMKMKRARLTEGEFTITHTHEIEDSGGGGGGGGDDGWKLAEVTTSNRVVSCAACGVEMHPDVRKVRLNPVKKHSGSVFHYYHIKCFRSRAACIAEISD